MKVLVAEDDASLREGMSDVLEELVAVRSAGTVEAALEALSQERFELVLTDLRLGGLGPGGRGILEAARRKLLPVAMVSAAAADELQRALTPLEADAVLAKPFQLDDMMALVERFLAMRRELERLSAQRPGEAGWTEVAAGVHLQKTAGAAPGQGPIWLRLQPGTNYSWAHLQGRAGVLVVEGDIEVEGTPQPAPSYLFLSASQPASARTGQGCLALFLAMRG